MIDKNKLKLLLNDKNIAMNISDDTIRFNFEVGRYNTWQEITASIDTAISKIQTDRFPKFKYIKIYHHFPFLYCPICLIFVKIK